MHATSSIIGLVSFTLIAACSTPAMTVVRHSGSPSALRGMTNVAVSFDPRATSVDGTPLAEYLASRGEDTAEMEEILEEMNQRLVTGVREHSGLGVALATGPGAHPGQIQLAVEILEVVPGVLRSVDAQDGTVHAHLTFMVDGETTDELDITARSPATSADQPTVRGRMQACGGRIGQLVGEYIRDAH